MFKKQNAQYPFGAIALFSYLFESPIMKIIFIFIGVVGFIYQLCCFKFGR